MKKIILRFLIKHRLIKELDLVTVLKLIKSDYIKRNKKKQNSSGICYCVVETFHYILPKASATLILNLKINIMNYISIAVFNKIMAINIFWFDDKDHNSRIDTLNKAIDYYKKYKTNIVLL